MKKYDFAFIYEGKNRELESISLIKYELERKGYSVYFVETWESILHRRKRVKADVVVTFALYSSGSVEYAASFVKDFKKIVSMQWEQVYTNGDAKQVFDIKSDGVYHIDGLAIRGGHISWGQVNYDRLTNGCGIPKKNVRITGSVALDFLRPEFRSFYMSREDLFSKYGLDPKRQTYLFISSFSYVDLPANYLESVQYQNVGFDINSFYSIANRSQKEVLDWFEKELVQHPEVDMIYRPHPAENGNKRLYEIQAKYKNFHVISDYSVKQWIVAVDKIYTWWSTSIAEIYAANRGCSILRPIDIPYDSEIESYNNANYVDTFEQFDREYLEQVDFPVSKEAISRYYYVDPEEPGYKKVVRFMEDIYADDYYNLPAFYVNVSDNDIKIALGNLRNLIKKKALLNDSICSILEKIETKLGKLDQKAFNRMVEEYRYIVKMASNNRYNQADVDEITARIKKCLE